MEGRNEIRKLQRMGRSTLVVSLPSDWIKKHGLHPSDKIVVETEEDGSIVLRPESTISLQTEKQCVIRASKCPDEKFLLRLIVGAYLMGCDTVRVNGLREE